MHSIKHLINLQFIDQLINKAMATTLLKNKNNGNQAYLKS